MAAGEGEIMGRVGEQTALGGGEVEAGADMGNAGVEAGRATAQTSESRMKA